MGLLGCALRRNELATLDCGHIQQRDGRWVFVDLVGKGKRIRTVPIPRLSQGGDRRLDLGGRFIEVPLVPTFAIAANIRKRRLWH